MHHWQADYLILYEVAQMHGEHASKASKPRTLRMPRIDVRRWIARLSTAAEMADTDALAAVSVQDAECA